MQKNDDSTVFIESVPVVLGYPNADKVHAIIPRGIKLLTDVLLEQSWAVGSIENHPAYSGWTKKAREGMARFFTAGQDIKNKYKSHPHFGPGILEKDFKLSSSLDFSAGYSKNFTKHGERWLDIYPRLPNTPNEAREAQAPLLNLGELYLDIKKHTLRSIFNTLSSYSNVLETQNAEKMLTDDLMLGMVYYAPTADKSLSPQEPLHGWHKDAPPLGFMLGPTTENPGIYLYSTLTGEYIPAPQLKENEFIIHTGTKLGDAFIKERFPFVPNYHYVEDTPHAQKHGRMALQFQG